MRKLKFAVSIGLLLVSITGCGTDVDTALFNEVDSLRLIPVDTIGVLMGDSTEMFGNIFDVTILPSGELVVVDLLKRCASVFDSRGQFIRQISTLYTLNFRILLALQSPSGVTGSIT